MSEIRNAMFDEACQLFEAFTRSPWRQFELNHGKMSLYITRLSNTERDIARKVGSRSNSDKIAEKIVFRAPHTATLVSLAPVGVTLRPGDSYGTIKVLDEPIELQSSATIEIFAHLACPGQLLEYWSPMLETALVDT